MKSTVTLPVVLLAAIVLGVASTSGRTEKASPRRQDTLEKRVAHLETSLEEQRQVLRDQDRQIRLLEERLGRVDAWFANLPATANLLEQGVDQTRSNGFTFAGANPKSREILLETLQRLAKNLEQANPVAPQKR